MLTSQSFILFHNTYTFEYYLAAFKENTTLLMGNNNIVQY